MAWLRYQMLAFAVLLRHMREAPVSKIRCAARRRLPRRSLAFFSGPIPVGAAEEPPLALVRVSPVPSAVSAL
ncbi:hypothetical protein F5148DRAFT_1233148 [Russula earlei]|uniref:Uncharacterized protein n=1 Tax=Russula earlei TaxID=71964 RepID=A0ACC0TZB4_9AGAM|nr:hypothetical protein F5148DRAFT_1233148 [Russula earlei]